MQTLLKLEEFDQATRDGCLVGVFDWSTASHLHILPCSRVQRRHFCWRWSENPHHRIAIIVGRAPSRRH